MPIVPPNWAGAKERSETAAKTSADVAAANLKLLLEGRGGEISLDVMGALRFFELIANNPKAFFDNAKGVSDVLIDYMVTFVTGLTIPDGTIASSLNTTNKELTRLSLGNIFQKLIDETMQTDAAAEGFLNRETGAAEAANTARLVGAAFRMQIGDMLADWIAKIIPFNLGDSLKDIAERIDKAINLDDAIEEIIQVPMEACVTKGLTQYYNRKLKPTDMTDNEARQAYIAGRISTSDYNKILDNTGVRDDIRDILLDFTAANLTESDINEAYQRNLLSIEEVKDQYKQKYFQEPERQIKTDLVKGTRRWTLQTKVVELLGNLYRDGVASKDECTPYLNQLGYENDEQELWFLQQDFERKQRKWLSSANLWDAVQTKKLTRQQAIDYLVLQGMTAEDAAVALDSNRKWLSNNELQLMLDAGNADVGWVIDYDVQQGMTGEDATLRWMSYLLKKHQKDLPEDCTKLLANAFSLSKSLSFIFEKIPEFGAGSLFGKGELQKIIQCLLTNTTKVP